MKQSLQEALSNAKSLTDKIENLLVESDGEINEHLDALLSFKSETELNIAQKVDLAVFTIERLQTNIDYYADQILQLKNIVALHEKAIGAIKERLAISLESMEITSLEGEYRRISMKKNPPSVEILDELAIPQEFKEIKIEEKINKKAIKEALEKNSSIQWARMVSKRSLKIDIAKPKLEGGKHE